MVTTILAWGTEQLAKAGAIMKRLASTETLGSTSAINSDKTGTLTLDQMTAVQMAAAGRRYAVEGKGYSTAGRITRVAGEADIGLDEFQVPMVLAPAAVVRDGELIGDPTEGPLVVLAAKGGINAVSTRDRYPADRRASVRRGLQADGHLPQDDRRVRQRSDPARRQGRTRSAAGPGRHVIDAGAGPAQADKIDGIGVIARVSPGHKVRLVDVLRRQGQIVAMTGDGVNAGGIPLLPLQTLWVSFTMLSIQSVGLGYSKPAAGLMDRPPLPPSRPILTRGLIAWLSFVGLLMAIGTLGVISGAEQVHGLAIARTMGMVTFALFLLFFSIESKDDRESAFSLDTFSARTFVITTSGSFVLLVLSTVLGIFHTVLKTVRQWLICTAVALPVVVAAEIRKAVLRRTAAAPGMQVSR